MSTARGLANHSLYMGKLLLDAWAQQAARADIPTQATDAAFAPAVRLHLLEAYGWFLLATIRLSSLPPSPPQSTHELPALATGLAIPGEVAEYRRLEQDGWLGRLQAPLPSGLPRRSKTPVLAMSGSYPQIQDYTEWCGSLGALFGRVSDSLDEN